MVNIRKHCLLICLTTTFASTHLWPGAEAKSFSKHTAVAAKTGLKSLVPLEDLTNEPDPSEVIGQAMKEYSAGHAAEAEKLFEKALQIDPNNADAHYNLGAIKEWSNDLNGSLLQYEAALRLKPNDKDIHDAVTAVAYKLKNAPAIAEQEKREKSMHDMAMHSQIA